MPKTKVKELISVENLMILIAHRRTERNINKYYKELGGKGVVTVSDVTRLLQKHPKLLKFVDNFIDKVEKEDSTT